MLKLWNDLPSSIKDPIRLIVVFLLTQVIHAIQSPPSVTVQTPPAAVTVQPAPVVFNAPPPAAAK